MYNDYGIHSTMNKVFFLGIVRGDIPWFILLMLVIVVGLIWKKPIN